MLLYILKKGGAVEQIHVPRASGIKSITSRTAWVTVWMRIKQSDRFTRHLRLCPVDVGPQILLLQSLVCGIFAHRSYAITPLPQNEQEGDEGKVDAG